MSGLRSQIRRPFQLVVRRLKAAYRSRLVECPQKANGPLGRMFRGVARHCARPSLHYVETHLTDHCNLNCQGCGHFAPLADKSFASVEQFSTDMKCLTTLFRSIARLRLLGGEPLLHPQVSHFLDAARSICPDTDIRLVTNGLLLERMPETFWAACRAHRVPIDVTAYPPVFKKLDDITSLLKAHGAAFRILHRDNFRSFYRFDGASDPMRAMTHCRRYFFCPFLESGRLFPCAYPAMAKYPNRAFKVNVPTDAAIDIHAPGVTGWDVIEFLARPNAACRFCATDYVDFDWSVSNRRIEEWDACYQSPAACERKAG